MNDCNLFSHKKNVSISVYALLSYIYHHKTITKIMSTPIY